MPRSDAQRRADKKYVQKLRGPDWKPQIGADCKRGAHDDCVRRICACECHKGMTPLAFITELRKKPAA